MDEKGHRQLIYTENKGCNRKIEVISYKNKGYNRKKKDKDS